MHVRLSSRTHRLLYRIQLRRITVTSACGQEPDLNNLYLRFDHAHAHVAIISAELWHEEPAAHVKISSRTTIIVRFFYFFYIFLISETNITITRYLVISSILIDIRYT